MRIHLLAGISIAIFLSVAAFGQSAELPQRFEIADIHTSAYSQLPQMRGILGGSRYELRKATMVDLIKTAYGIDADNVVGGPTWLESDRFDVIAKTPPTATRGNARAMLQTLLADRFKLVVHTDTRPMPAFVLSIGKGKPKLKESEGQGNEGCQFQPQKNQPGVFPPVVVSCRHISMDAFARRLRQIAGDYVSLPVIDSTGLEGFWDFDLKWSYRMSLAQAGSDGVTIFDALDKQLGLKLDSQKAPAPVVVVDSVNRTPTANPPGIATSLPPGPPPEFEVADIKPSMPDAKPNARLQNGRLDVQAFPMKYMIMLAWNLTGNELLAGAPKWIESARFDIVAKAATPGPQDAGDTVALEQVDLETLRLMLRALLVDRFKIVTHTEERPINSYTLVAVKP